MKSDNIPSWHIVTWGPVFVREHAFDAMVKRMRPLGVTIDTVQNEKHRRGTVLWGVNDDRIHAGIAWDWLELTPGVIVMADPMKILSNLRVMADDEDGCELDGRLLRFNRALHRMHWQPALRRALPREEALAA